MIRQLLTLGTLLTLSLSVRAQTYTHSLRNNTYAHLNESLRTYKDSNAFFDTTFKTSFQILYFGKAISDSIIIFGNSNFAITEFEFDDEASAFGAELMPRKDGKSFIAQTTEGSSPNRIFKIEWGNIGFQYDTLGNDSVNFQVWFYENGGIIEYHYGPSSVKNPFSWNGETGAYVYLVDYDGNNTYGLKGNPSAPLTYTSFITGAGPLLAVPASNSVFRFTPAAGNSVAEIAQPATKLRSIGGQEFEIHSISPIHNLRLMDLNGKICLKDMATRFSTDHLPAGVYFLQVETASGAELHKIVNP